MFKDYDDPDYWNTVHYWAECSNMSYEDLWNYGDIPDWNETLDWIKAIPDYKGGKNLWD